MTEPAVRAGSQRIASCWRRGDSACRSGRCPVVTHLLPVSIALWAGAATLAAIAALAAIATIARLARGSPTLRSPLKIAFASIIGPLILAALPLSVAMVVAVAAASVAIALGAPPIAWPFVSLAGAAMFVAATRMPGHDKEGCIKLLALISAYYVVVWGFVAFHLTRGLAHLSTDLLVRDSLLPLLTGLPFAALLFLITGRKRSIVSAAIVLCVIAGWAALCFFTAEQSRAAWLPASPWLRYPLSGMIGMAPLLLPNLIALATGGHKGQLGEIALLLGFLGVTTGLAWAAAHALIA